MLSREEVLTILEAHREEIERLGVKSLRLFGSVARGEASAESDVDLLVEFDQRPTFSGYMGLRLFLEDLLGAKVDLITESGLKERARPYVEKDAIVIWGSESGFGLAWRAPHGDHRLDNSLTVCRVSDTPQRR